jgi:hypothetical protein
MTLTAAHSDAQIDRVLDTLERLGVRLGIIPGSGRVREAAAAVKKAG